MNQKIYRPLTFKMRLKNELFQRKKYKPCNSMSKPQNNSNTVLPATFNICIAFIGHDQTCIDKIVAKYYEKDIVYHATHYLY